MSAPAGAPAGAQLQGTLSAEMGFTNANPALSQTFAALEATDVLSLSPQPGRAPQSAVGASMDHCTGNQAV
ncbi:MAG: hypothetical protein WDO68_01365 [Gammaproteobacteria bacterium]